MRILDTGINDRGSKYAVSGGPVGSRADIQAFLAALKREKRFARATHNSWAAILADGSPLKGDDGEAGAGNVILQHLQASGLSGHLIVVTRWYGGRHLGGDRFRHVAEAVRLYLSSLP
ncbi:MAG: YigZ family protein [Paracoccaceae bacterium]|jgi:putative IMPACT (imprinted ancient) family translation regulator